jgi:hypothetical protein
MERSEGDMSLKNPVTPPGIDPGTVRIVAQRLNHYATPGPTYPGTYPKYIVMGQKDVFLKEKCGVFKCIFTFFVPDMKVRKVSTEAFCNYLFHTYDSFPINRSTTDFRQKYQECYAFVKHNAKTLHEYTGRLSATAAAAQTHLTMLRYVQHIKEWIELDFLTPSCHRQNTAQQ